MTKNYMLVIFRSDRCCRSMTDTPPFQRVLGLHSRDITITEVEIYKYLKKLKDYRYMCTIKFDKILSLK